MFLCPYIAILLQHRRKTTVIDDGLVVFKISTKASEMLINT